MSSEVINIKGTRNGLVICLDSDRDFDELKNTLRSKIESSQGFFRGAKFTFHLEKNILCAEKTRELEEICCQNGLILDHQIPWRNNNSKKTPNKIRRIETVREKAISPEVKPLLTEASPSIPSVGLLESDKKPCLLVHRSLRSGQKIRFNGSVVIFGDVNPGSEVTATGDIIIMGNLRGVVHAGANGDTDSVITAFRLNPIQLRIGTVISRPPENNGPGNYPETAKLRNGQMTIEPYITHGLKQR